MRMARLACHRPKNRASYGFTGNRRYRKCYSDPDFYGFLRISMRIFGAAPRRGIMRI